MAAPIYTNAGALVLARTVKTMLALSLMKLFTNVVALTPSTKKSDLVEATYDGYAAKTLTVWNKEYLDPVGGASIQSGLEQYDYGPPGTPPVTQAVTGFWVENAAGELIVVALFDAPISMAHVGDSIPLSAVLNFGG